MAERDQTDPRIVQSVYRLEAVVGAQVSETREAMRTTSEQVKAIGVEMRGGFDRLDGRVNGLEMQIEKHCAWHDGSEQAGARTGGKVTSWTSIVGVVLALVVALCGAVWAIASSDNGGMDERALARAVRAAMHDTRPAPAPDPGQPGGGG